MKLYFSIFILVSINHVLAQLNREIKINHHREETTTQEIRTTRTLRTYQTNYSPRMSRRTTTIPHIIDKTCLLKPDSGPCRGRIPMWYFDPKENNCSTFYWGGCQGNGNRYDKQSECISTCLSGSGWKERRPRYCNLNFDYGWCFGADERYYYDRQWGVCKKTIYSGCGGNKNNFYSKEKCDDICTHGSFSLHSRREKEDMLKKVLIVNPHEFTQSRGGGGGGGGGSGGKGTQTAKMRTGSWWLDDIKKKFPNKMIMELNKIEESSTISNTDFPKPTDPSK